MAKTDKRVIYTESVIREAYLKMLEEMPTEKITVAELCRRAGINRGTFYLHYKDCYELLERLGFGLASEIELEMSSLFDSKKSLESGVNELLKILFKNRGSSHILFLNEKSKCFDIISEKSKSNTINSWLERSQLTPLQAEMVYSYITGGCFCLAKDIWSGALPADNPESYGFLFSLISRGLSSLVDSLPA